MKCLPDPKCFCPDCGQPLKPINAFLAKCENGHSWELTLAGGRTNLAQVFNGADDDCEEDGELGEPELELAREWN